MTTYKNFTYLLLALLFIASCSDDDNTGPREGDDDKDGIKYIITSTPVASQGVADYLLTADDLTKGSVTTVGNGVEQDGTYRYYITSNNRFFSLLYGQGNPGAVTTYELDGQGKLDRISNFQSETVQAFTAVNDDILMTKIPRSGDENAKWYRINTESVEIVDEGQINIVDLAGNGERAHFTWLTQVGDRVFAPYMSIKACCDDAFGTQYPDSSWIAVFSYPEMALQKVIKDNRTSYIGRYFTNGLAVDEKGDVYGFSSSLATTNDVFTSTKPSAIVRIKNGETEFDQEYFFNVEQVSGGYHMTDQNYVGNGKFILMMAREKTLYSVGKKFAIADVYNQTITWVEGAPDPDDITSVTSTNLVTEDGTAFIGITTENGSFVYQFDAHAATATKGLEVIGGQITAISKLEVNN